MAAWNTVSRQYIARIKRARAAEGGGSGDMGEFGI